MGSSRHAVYWLCGLALVAAPAPRAAARVPFEQFLEALRDHQCYDEAADYLELIGRKESLDPEIKERLLYEQGVNWLTSATRQSDPKLRDAQLAKATSAFDQFEKDHPKHVLVPRAQIQTANSLLERGRTIVEAARQSGSSPTAMADARRLFEQARDQLAKTEKQIESRLGEMPKLVAPEEKDQLARKRALGGEVVQARLLAASVDYEVAQSYEPGSADAKKHLTTAAKAYSHFYDDYRTRTAGLLARLWEGRCYQELEKSKEAVGCFRELMELQSSPDTRVLKAKATRHALECWTKDGEKKYQEAIEFGERWEKESGGNQTDADALAIHYLTALAYQAQSNTLPDRDPNRKKLVSFARQYVGPVAQHPGEYQRPARMLLVALGAAKDTKEGGSKSTAFTEAFERGKQALEQLQAAAAAANTAEGAEKVAIEKKNKDCTADALSAFRAALEKSDAKSSTEDVNLARYYLCFLAWDAKQYYDAAALGEFLAVHYPDSLPGRQGARIALHAFAQLYSDSKNPDKSFETARIERIAKLIYKHWPGQEEADDAALMELRIAASQMQVDKTLECLQKIPEKSPRRGTAELSAGQTLWSTYLRSAPLPEDKRPPQDRLDKLKQQSRQVLESGIARVEKAGQVDALLAAGAFSMAQICVEAGQPDKAIEWLENEKFGPLMLVESKSPAAERENFAVETYKVALRAYIAVNPQQLGKAENVMNALEKQVQSSGDAKASQNLTAIYVSLGRELQQHLAELRKQKKTEELEAVSKAFEVFLDRVTKRDTGASFSSLIWVGETYYSLGSGLDEGGTVISPKASEYFKKAAEAYKRMLEIAEKDPKYKENPDGLVTLRLRLADCYRRGGKHDEAVGLIVAVLRQKPQLITAQVQGAETYQTRGAVEPKAYAQAINGSTPARDRQNIIWGWGKLSKVAMNDPRFRDTFHQARLNLAECRYRYALSQKEKETKVKVLEAAKNDLWYTYKLHKDLGGDSTQARYEGWLKQIQKALGNPEIGLKEFKERDEKATTAAAEKK